MPDKTSDNKPKRDKKGRLLPGQTANLKGRPKRSWSIRDKFWKRFEKNPKALKAFMEVLLEKYPGLVWQMLEGKPTEKIDLGLEVEKESLKSIEDFLRQLANPKKNNERESE